MNADFRYDRLTDAISVVATDICPSVSEVVTESVLMSDWSCAQP